MQLIGVFLLEMIMKIGDTIYVRASVKKSKGKLIASPEDRYRPVTVTGFGFRKVRNYPICDDRIRSSHAIPNYLICDDLMWSSHTIPNYHRVAVIKFRKSPDSKEQDTLEKFIVRKKDD